MVSSIILNESIRKLGKAGDVVQVKPGYARYLVSIKKVVRATEKNLKFLEEKRLSIEEDNRNKFLAAEKLKLSLTDKILVIVRQSSDDSKLFGSVTSKDISKLLAELNYDIHHTKIFFDGAIKTLGDYSISIELHADVIISIPLHVVRNESAAQEIKRTHLSKKQSTKDSIDNEGAVSL